MRAEDLPQSFVPAFGEQVQVDVAEGRQKPVTVGDGVNTRLTGTGVADLESVIGEVGERQ